MAVNQGFAAVFSFNTETTEYAAFFFNPCVLRVKQKFSPV